MAHFTTLNRYGFVVPGEVKVMMLIAKALKSMEAVVQLLASETNLSKLRDLEAITNTLYLAWETSWQQGVVNVPSNQQWANKLSTVNQGDQNAPQFWTPSATFSHGSWVVQRWQSPMGHGPYNVVQRWCTTHDPWDVYTIVQPMAHGELVIQGSWVVQPDLEYMFPMDHGLYNSMYLSMVHGLYNIIYIPWIMDCTMVHIFHGWWIVQHIDIPWPMGDGLYNNTYIPWFMGCTMVYISHGPWVVQLFG